MPTRCVTEARWLSRGRLSCVDWARAKVVASSTMNPSMSWADRWFTGVLLIGMPCVGFSVETWTVRSD
jgi:hypothetical protein